MKYILLDTPHDAGVSAVLQDRSINVPDWFKPFWYKLITQKNLKSQTEFEFRLKRVRLYNELVPLFNELDEIKDTKDLNKKYGNYARTLQIACSYCDFGIRDDKDKLLDIIIDLDDIEFIIELTKLKWNIFKDDTCYGICKYVKNRIENNNLSIDRIFNLLQEYTFHLTITRGVAHIRQDKDSSYAMRSQAHRSVCALMKILIRNLSVVGYSSVHKLYELPITTKDQFYQNCLIIALKYSNQEAADYFYNFLSTEEKNQILEESGFYSWYFNDSYDFHFSGELYTYNSYLYSKSSRPPAMAWKLAQTIYNSEHMQTKINLIYYSAEHGITEALDLIIYDSLYDKHLRGGSVNFNFSVEQRIYLLSIGANNNHTRCMEKLADLYMDNEKIKPNYVEALKLYLRLENYEKVAHIFRHTTPMLRNEYQAFKHYELAYNKKNSPDLLFEIAKSHHHGLGTEINITEAIRLYEKLGMEHEFRTAFYELSEIYRLGYKNQISIDLELSDKYYTMSNRCILCDYSRMMQKYNRVFKKNSSIVEPSNDLAVEQRQVLAPGL